MNMPWTPTSFKNKHNKKLSSEKAKAAAAQANAMLKAGIPEGEAIATANKNAKKKTTSEKMYGKSEPKK